MLSDAPQDESDHGTFLCTTAGCERKARWGGKSHCPPLFWLAPPTPPAEPAVFGNPGAKDAPQKFPVFAGFAGASGKRMLLTECIPCAASVILSLRGTAGFAGMKRGTMR